MSLAIYNGVALVVVSGNAQPANGATVEVRRESDSGLASIFSDNAGASPISQPGFVADSNGQFAFYAAGIDLGYKITVTKGADTFVLRNQAVGTAQQRDAGAQGALVVASATVADAIAALLLTEKTANWNYWAERAARRARLYAAQNLT